VRTAQQKLAKDLDELRQYVQSLQADVRALGATTAGLAGQMLLLQNYCEQLSKERQAQHVDEAGA
jgi:hypothetical protein